MLVLSRKPEQSVTIGDDVVVKVLGIDNGYVRLGFDAPRDVAILRDNAKKKDAPSAR